eukprot:3556174-Rhodomonas_salina.1
MSGTRIAYRDPADHVTSMPLCARYAMSGTHIAYATLYAPTHALRDVRYSHSVSPYLQASGSSRSGSSSLFLSAGFKSRADIPNSRRQISKFRPLN